MDDLVSAAGGVYDAAVDLRRHLHAHPELSFAEHATTAVVRERMSAVGWAELPSPTATGALFELTGARPGRSVLLRADLDALPVDEEVDVPWRSTVTGAMHACGHDVHTAILCATAAVLAARAEELPGRYVALFQPAEEALGGARAMLEGGLLDTAQVDAACGLHIAAPLPVGLVATRPGVFMAACQAFAVDIRGAGGHGALMGGEGNVVLAAAHLADGVAGVVAGLPDEDGTPCAASAGSIHAGTAANVVPRHARLTGTIRTFRPEQGAEALGRLRALCEEVAMAHAVECAVTITGTTPALVNDATAADVALRAIRAQLGTDSAFEMPPMTPSEDMAEILARVPGVFLAVGARLGASEPPQHHAADFEPHEESLRTGTVALAATAVALSVG